MRRTVRMMSLALILAMLLTLTACGGSKDTYELRCSTNLAATSTVGQGLAKFVELVNEKSGGKIIANKGATFYAVSMSVCHICKCLLSGIDTTMTVSTMMHGEYGVEDVCLSTLALVGSDGVHTKITSPLTPEETEKMQLSAQKLKEIINGLEI